MLFALLTMLAEDAPANPPAGPASPLGGMMVPMLLTLALLYLMVLRPQARRQEMERKLMQESMQKNDRVLTAAGIYGTIAAVSEKEDEVTIKVDDNVRLRMTKASILKNFSAEERFKEPRKETKEGAA